MASSCINRDNFFAVALVINRSRDGPAFVFHYPPHVQTPGTFEAPDPSDLEDILLERLSQPANRDTGSGGGGGGLVASSSSASAGVGAGAGEELPRQWDRDEHIFTESGVQIVPWEHVAGFPARDLAGILTPARPYHKRLFQLSLDPLHCVSYPIHVPENGKWKKPKKSDKGKAASSSKQNEDLSGASLPEPDVTSSRLSDGPKDKDQSQNQNQAQKKDDGDDEKRSSMTMFNLVFILNPKQTEVKELVDTLYSHIVRKANKAYKYSQSHSDFVWKESKRILAAKDKAREEQKKMSILWKEILLNSSLAASMHDIYEAVSQNKIASLHLDTAAGSLTPSLQIPVPFYISDLPQASAGERDQRGLWLTTANAFMSQDNVDEPGFLDRNFALLLMDDEKKIVGDLQTDPDPTTVSMVEFVRLCKPTMSFHQVAQSNILTLSQVRKYAQHFIYWRRAIAIPPLHARDVYVLSPNCDPRRLAQDSQDWQRAFPVAPPLPNFLSELSQSPRPFKHITPSKAHRPSYLLMLAWLMRRGWVTQLCTFAYVIVWPEIIYEVDYEMEAEELAAAAAAAATSTSLPASSGGDDSEQRPRRSHSAVMLPIDESTASIAASSELTVSEPDQADDISTSNDTHTGNNTSLLAGGTASEDASHAQSSVQHAAEAARLERVAAKAHQEATDKVIAHARRVVPRPTVHPSLNDSPHLKGITPHLVLDAKKATGRESRYLSAIARRFKDQRIRAAWQQYCRYFDGRSALERIALQEDMKRKEVWNQLTAMTEYLLCTRHW